MKILFQGGWKAGRDPQHLEPIVAEYCAALASRVVRSSHQIVLTSAIDYDMRIAESVAAQAASAGRGVKDVLLFLLPEPYTTIPTIGRVVTLRSSRWRQADRTDFVQQADALVAVGGGKGTADCIDKAFLIGKPVFVACGIPGPAVDAWRRRPADYHYLKPGDADFVADVNVTPADFFDAVFRTIDALADIQYPRRIFVIHGRDHQTRDRLVSILDRLGFEAIVLENEASKGLTVIEKLERDTARVGFAFVLYTPDDLGHLPGEPERGRARQNVIFEHGLLTGLLGRGRACALVRGDVEIPSDLSGVIYESIGDMGQAALAVARVLKQAGYDLDLNRLLDAR